MDRGAALFCVILFVMLAGLTSLASSKVGSPDTNGAAAAAIEAHLGQFVGIDVIEGKDASFDELTLCIESKVPLSMEAIARNLAGTILHPVSADTCTSETIEGDFGMFTSQTRYYDGAGNGAGHLEVVKASCPNATECTVDIDDVGLGARYLLRRDGEVWSVLDATTRWVV